MTSLCLKFVAALEFGMFFSLGAGQMLQSQTNTQPSMTLSPGDDLQSTVASAPAGTAFLLTAGVYRMQSMEPKAGDSFSGQGAVVLNGSQLLSFEADPAGSGLWVASATASSVNHGACLTTSPLCGYTQDLFIDNAVQIPVSSLQGLKAGSWYFNRVANTVYVPTNPEGHVVEIGMTNYAFYGSANGVQISNLTVEKYATAAQYAPVGGDSSGTEWVVNNVEARWNHGRGISLGSNSQILNSFVHHNGQLGISLYGTNSKAINNELSWNNYAGFDASWEAGGSKFWATTDLVVQYNYVHDNAGHGLWADTNNVGTVYDSNTVINNLYNGIKHEVSYSATISNNIVKGNGNNTTAWLWNAQICVQNSSNVKVYRNTVEVASGGGNGIAVINQNRGTGSMGPWVAANDTIYNNTVTYLGSNGASGMVDDAGGNSAVGNSFNSDKYVAKSEGGKHWAWITWMDWSGFQGSGQEASGTCCN